MSVVLFLRRTKSGEEIDIPIATEEVFTKYWRKIAQKNSLGLIVDMQAGYRISFDHLADIFRELKLMKEAFLAESGLDDGSKDFFGKRIDYILEKIEPELDNPSVEGFVV